MPATKTVMVLQDFKLTRDDGTEKWYEKGRQTMPRADADHYYTKLHLAPTAEAAASGSFERVTATRKYADERKAEWQEAEDEAQREQSAFDQKYGGSSGAVAPVREPGGIPEHLRNTGSLTETQMADLNAAALQRGEEAPFPGLLPATPTAEGTLVVDDGDEGEDADDDDGEGEDDGKDADPAAKDDGKAKPAAKSKRVPLKK